ncbi:MAG TPA: amidohydrolase family protein, partial [Bacillota bacterium]|nr:amidohydrolase family protein [Bacillota bacterium]
NAMRPFHHRNIGIIGLIMEQPKFSFDIIVDGVHVAPEFIRLLSRICHPKQILLITDAIRAAGLGDGQYDLGGQEVIVCNGEARLRSGVLAGSLLTLDVALKNVINYTGKSLVDAIDYLTINPASKLGIDGHKGSIKVGKDADLVLLDQELRVQATWVKGELVYQAGDF